MDFLKILMVGLQSVYLGIFAFASIDLEKAIHRFLGSLLASKKNLIIQQKENYEKEYFYTWEDFYDYRYDKFYLLAIVLAYFLQIYTLIKNEMYGYYVTILKDMFINAYCFFIIAIFFLLLAKKIKNGFIFLKKVSEKMKKKE